MINSLIIFGIGCILSLVIHIIVFLYVNYYLTKYGLRVIVDKITIIEFLILTVCNYLGIIGTIVIYYDQLVYIHELNKTSKHVKYKRPFLNK